MKDFENILQELKDSIIQYDKIKAKELAKIIIDKKINLLKSLEILTDAMRYVGDKFKEEELWLPDLLAASDAMKASMEVFEKEIKRRGIKKEILGNIVIGTVHGDIHNIGKDMVAAFLKSAGYEVYDIGVDVATEKFIDSVKMNNADILAMSSLLTTNITEMEKVINALEREHLRQKISVIVGGGAITKEFAEQIDADGYEPTAVEAVELVNGLLMIKRGA